ncbi:MAG: inorganic diphosphatase [Candidatus Micrarchaeota archaeon]|nr:inorganic diphosphatase [Candidatus Micrarchaeota archaeon]
MVIRISKGSKNIYSRGSVFPVLIGTLDKSCPANYGIIPRAHSLNGLGCFVFADEPIVPCTLVRARVIGSIKVESEGITDDEILAVSPESSIKDVSELPADLLEEVKSFLTHLKKKELGATVKFKSIKDKEKAEAVVERAIELYKALGE